MKKIDLNKMLLMFLMIMSTSFAFAQVGVGTNTPDASSALEVQSTSKGLLTPRMTQAQRTAIASPANGLVVYQTDGTAGFYYYNGTAWNTLNADPDIKWVTSTNNLLLPNAKNAYVIENDTLITIGQQGGLVFRSKASVLSSSNPFAFQGKDNLVNGGFTQVSVESQNQGAFFTTLDEAVSQATPSKLYKDILPNRIIGGNVYDVGHSTANIGSSTRSRNRIVSIFATVGTVSSTNNAHVSGNYSLSATNSEGVNNEIFRVVGATQNMGIGTTSPNASAALDVSSTTKGFLPPRMTSTQLGSIPSPAEGLVVYCTNCIPKGLRVFNGTNWEDMNGVTPSPATFTFTGNFYHDLNFYSGKFMDANNILYLEVNVTAVGQISISSPTVNGYTFSSFVTTTSTGLQYIPVSSSGTQTAYNAAGDAFNITGIGTTTQTQAIVVINSQIGSSFTSFSNGSQNFSANSSCSSKPISAGHSAGTCSGSITVGSNTYPVVLINGQCWMQTNLKETPTSPCADSINTGCNTWLNSNVGNIGSWGYYNTATTNGTAGWATSEPGANEGLLYQWSAAMNGSTTERAQGLCPTGWHIPSDCEWMYLEHGQGMSIEQQTTDNTWRNTTGEGHKLRGVGGTFTNSSGFTALLAGGRVTNGTFNNRGSVGYWWSSSEASPTGARIRGLNSSQAGVYRFSNNKASGFSVRCLKD